MTLPDSLCLGDMTDHLTAPVLGVTVTLQKHQSEKP